MSDLKKQLLNGEKKIGVWGIGYIGISSMAYYARAGINCIGFDVSEQRVDDVNTKGESVPTLPNIKYWIAFDINKLIKKKLIYATHDYSELFADDIAVHLVTIPTEKDGKPYHEILKDVLAKIFGHYKKNKLAEPPLVIIESTLTPNAFEEVIFPLAKKIGVKIGKDVLMGSAPRRDWFVSPEFNLKTLPRVVGGTDKYTTNLMADVCGIISNKVYKASSHRVAAMVKSAENSNRHINILWAIQLSLAYPNDNIEEVLKLASTKWNIGRYHASFGTGGYCIPLSSQYVMNGADHPEKLTILKSAMETDLSQPKRVAQSIVDKGYKNIGIMGLAYTQDLKVSILSPTIGLVKEFKRLGVKVKVNDPLFSSTEIKDICGADSFQFPNGLKEFDAILIVAGHLEYKSIPQNELIANLKNCKFILDNMGDLKNVEFPERITYKEVGDANWLN